MRELNLYIFPRRDAAGKIEYTLSRDKAPPPPKDPPPGIDLPRKSGRWLFVFKIENGPDTNVEFKEDFVWAGEDCACPPPQGITTDQVTDATRLNASQATFINRNKGRPRTIVYQLNMQEGEVDWPLDPEIRNGGGTGNLWAYLAIAGACVGAAAAFLGTDSVTDQIAWAYVLGGAIIGAIAGAVLDRLR